MEPVETIQITPDVRVQLYPDTDASNPLENWEHGIQFLTLPDPSRTWRDYADPNNDPYTNIRPLDVDPENFQEFWNSEWREPYQNKHNAPSLRTFLDTNCAAWLPITREGYNGTIVQDYDDLEKADAIVLVSRDMYREWHGIPEGKPMPRGYRADAARQLQGVIDEYNKWATGDCYGYQVQRHDPLCLDCMDPDDADPDPDCDNWHDTDDSCWGFIGYEYAQEEATHAGMAEAGIPIPQVTSDQRGIVLERMTELGNGDSPARRTLYPTKPRKGSQFAIGWTVHTGTYDQYRADRIDPKYTEYPGAVVVHFRRDEVPQHDDKIVMHRLSWESAQRTMRHLAQR